MHVSRASVLTRPLILAGAALILVAVQPEPVQAKSPGPLSNSRSRYVPAKLVKKGPWLKRKIQNHRVRKARRLQRGMEKNLQPQKKELKNLFGLIKRGQYHNMVLRGATSGGEAVTIVAGKHRGFPFVSNKANWDNVQLQVGKRSFAINNDNLSRLTIAFKGKGEAKKVLVSYDGPVNEQRLTAHSMKKYDRKKLPAPGKLGTKSASFQVEMSVKSLGMMPIGLPGVFGMEYFPNQVKASKGGRLVVDGKQLGLKSVKGELESGRMSNLTSRRSLAAVYDYKGTSGPDASGHVAFVGKGAGSGKPGRLRKAFDKVFSGVARLTGSRSFGYGPEGIRHNAALSQKEGKIVAHDVVRFKNGVTLERRVVEVKDNKGKTHHGLQERFF